tara:strand:+ start:5956 stop:7113 length:1158 start_codon:yes stop_codon:yes gene_type:complete
MKYIKQRKVNEANIKKEFDIPSIIWELNSVFNKNGYKLYVVGGAIRDFETGDKPKDFDLCTDALPDDVIRILSPQYKVQLQGEAFAVVVVFTEEEPLGMEIATFRIDVTTGRNPEVKVGGVTIEEDVMRRDLTINGMFYDLETKEIIDLVGGIDDLRNKIIRMIGDPDERIADDPLRILRVFRFATRYGSKLDQKTIDAIHLNNDISSVSMERIWDRVNGEFWKSFKQAKDFQQYLDFLVEFNVMEQILPGLNVDSKINNQDSMVLVLAQMLKNNDIKKLRKVMNKPCSIPTDVIEQVTFLIELLNFDKNRVVTIYESKVRVKMDNKTISKWLIANNIQDHDTNKFILYTPSVKSEDVMKKFGLGQSRELGIKIKELEVEQFNKL